MAYSKERQKEYNKAYREKHKAEIAANYQVTKEKVKAKQKLRVEEKRKWRKSDRAKKPDLYRSRMLKHRYGIDLKQYNEMFEERLGLCDICRQPETKTINGKTIPLAVDHSHVNGQIRGLLCSACNLILGNAKDNLQTLLAAAKYLQNSIRL